MHEADALPFLKLLQAASDLCMPSDLLLAGLQYAPSWVFTVLRPLSQPRPVDSPHYCG